MFVADPPGPPRHAPTIIASPVPRCFNFAPQLSLLRQASREGSAASRESVGGAAKGRVQIVRMGRLVLVALAAIGVPGIVRAADPVALIEDIKGPASGVEVLDYVAAGKVIRLPPGTVLTIGYFRSCTHEVVSGGTVTIGAESSRVEGGKVESSRVECDGGRMKLTAAQAAQSGVIAFRGKPPQAVKEPDQVLFGTRPLLRADKTGKVTIEAVDGSGPKFEVSLAGKRAAYDFARHGQTLAAGGLYRATGPSGQIVFRIDPGARAEGVPALGRLLRL
jgi:hypothetical protein